MARFTVEEALAAADRWHADPIIPVLAAEVRRLRALMARPTEALQVIGLGQARILIADLIADLTDERDQLAAEVRRLREIERRARDVANTSGEDVHPAGPRKTAQHILGEA